MAHLNQIAMSVTDLRRTHAWYTRVFGFLPAGGTDSFRGLLAEKVQGIKGAASSCWWLVDQQDFFQLELFEFERPAVQPLPTDWRLCDIGYGMVGIYCADFDAVLQRLAEVDSPLLTSPLGEPGQRRVCVRDPEGVLLELLERDPLEGRVVAPVRAAVPLATRAVTLSVADLEQSRSFFVDVLGLEVVTDFALHDPEHEQLWGLAGAQREQLLLRADGVLVELVQYLDPVGKPRPAGYQISDQGLLNIALGYRSYKELAAVHKRCQAAGIKGNWRVLPLGAWSVVYVNDQQGFSVELLHVAPWYDARMGFLPRPAPVYRRKRSGRDWDTAIISGAGSGIGLQLAQMLLREGCSVAVIDRSDCEQAKTLLQPLASARPGLQVEFFQADVTDDVALTAAVTAAVRTLGAPQLAINSAGIQVAKPFEELSAEDFSRVVSVNLVGSRNFAAATLPHMLSGSQLVLVASMAGLVPMHSYAAYNASKYGVVGLAGALRLEYIARGIEVSVVCPPEVDTPMVVQERKTLPPVAVKLKDSAGSLQLVPACDMILADIRRRRAQVVPGWRAKLVVWAGRHFPGVTRWFSERVVLSTL